MLKKDSFLASLLVLFNHLRNASAKSSSDKPDSGIGIKMAALISWLILLSIYCIKSFYPRLRAKCSAMFPTSNDCNESTALLAPGTQPPATTTTLLQPPRQSYHDGGY